MLVVALGPGRSAPPECSPHGRDTDGDGLTDCLERRTGTDPLSHDTDGDGVPDGVEDANRDGQIDPGESDPRTTGLFPGRSPNIPEPLSFDLVRGLGARRGELETNVLLEFPVGGVPEWAPEIEWAFADGAAIEFELPIRGAEIEAVKFAAQLTLPRRRGGHPGFIHGLQTIFEAPLAGPTSEFTTLYLYGYRFSRQLSVLGMAGVRTQLDLDDPLAGLHNLSLFVEADERVAVGIETNLAVSREQTSVLILPQLHLQISRRLSLQVGAGVSWSSDGGFTPMFAMRPILE